MNIRNGWLRLLHQYGSLVKKRAIHMVRSPAVTILQVVSPFVIMMSAFVGIWLQDMQAFPPISLTDLSRSVNYDIIARTYWGASLIC